MRCNERISFCCYSNELPRESRHFMNGNREFINAKTKDKYGEIMTNLKMETLSSANRCRGDARVIPNPVPVAY